MEGLSLGQMATGVAVVVGNVIGLKWLRADQKKQEDAIKQHRADIEKLFDKLEDTMTKKDIKELVTECVGVLQKDNEKTATAIDKMADSVSTIREDFIRIDERYKNHISQSQRHDDK